MSRKALATLVIGEHFQYIFDRWFRPSWEAYCARHKLDLVVVNKPLDDSDRGRSRSPSWQKLLIHQAPELAGYSQIAWVDCDIAISPHAPNVFDFVPVEKVGAANDRSIPTPEDHLMVLERSYAEWTRQGIHYFSNLTAREYYANVGIACDFEGVVQAGVFVFSPAHHAGLMERVYRDYESAGADALNHEMRFFSYELLKAGLVEWISAKFNMTWTFYQTLYYPILEDPGLFPGPLPLAAKKALSRYLRKPCVLAALRNNYFLHFSGRSKDYLFLD